MLILFLITLAFSIKVIQTKDRSYYYEFFEEGKCYQRDKNRRTAYQYVFEDNKVKYKRYTNLHCNVDPAGTSEPSGFTYGKIEETGKTQVGYSTFYGSDTKCAGSGNGHYTLKSDCECEDPDARIPRCYKYAVENNQMVEREYNNKECTGDVINTVKIDCDTCYEYEEEGIGVFKVTCTPYPSDDNHKVFYKGSGYDFTFYEPGKCYLQENEFESKTVYYKYTHESNKVMYYEYDEAGCGKQGVTGVEAGEDYKYGKLRHDIAGYSTYFGEEKNGCKDEEDDGSDTTADDYPVEHYTLAKKCECDSSDPKRCYTYEVAENTDSIYDDRMLEKEFTDNQCKTPRTYTIKKNDGTTETKNVENELYLDMCFIYKDVDNSFLGYYKATPVEYTEENAPEVISIGEGYDYTFYFPGRCYSKKIVSNKQLRTNFKYKQENNKVVYEEFYSDTCAGDAIVSANPDPTMEYAEIINHNSYFTAYGDDNKCEKPQYMTVIVDGECEADGNGHSYKYKTESNKITEELFEGDTCEGTATKTELECDKCKSYLDVDEVTRHYDFQCKKYDGSNGAIETMMMIAFFIIALLL